MTDHQARIAQMESSRIVGGRAQTQALLRAPTHRVTPFNRASAPDAEDLALTAVQQPTVPAAVGANQFSLRDGLGIHEPGSMTRGGCTPTPAPPGRALKSAKCPAVTQFNSVRRPAKPTAAVVSVQPPSVAAAVEPSSRSMRPSSGAASTTAVGDASPRIAAAFSSELPFTGDRQAVAASGFALAATADADIEFAICGLEAQWRADGVLNSVSTLRTAAASVIAANSKSVSVGA